jgi:hypothetical protein
MSLIYPRLQPQAASELVARARNLQLEALRRDSQLTHPQVEYYTSGVRVEQRQLAEVRGAVHEVLDQLGFPDPHRGQNARINAFDHEIGRRLHQKMQIVPADAASPDVWAFMTLVLLPDAAMWRYPYGDLDRLLGGPRNTLRRLWWRGFVLGDGPDDPPARLGEDQLVQVMERPTVGGNPRVARAFCTAYLREQDRRPELPRMIWMRDAAKRLIRLTAFVAVDALDDEQLIALMNEVVANSAARMSTGSPGPGDAVGGVR